jgi:hypothetical protein
MELFEELARRGPTSVADLAQAVMRPKQSLYYHMHGLVKAGVVRVVERRKATRQVEAVYAVVPRARRAAAREESARAAALARRARTVLGRAQRDFDRLAAEGESTGTAFLDGRVLHLSPDEVRRLAREVTELLRRRRPGGTGRPHFFAFALVPQRRRNS